MTWGQVADPEAFREYLNGIDNLAAVLLRYETSTSVLHPLAELSKLFTIIKRMRSLSSMVSALGGADIHMDRDKIDCLAPAARKQ